MRHVLLVFSLKFMRKVVRVQRLFVSLTIFAASDKIWYLSLGSNEVIGNNLNGFSLIQGVRFII